MCLLLYLAKAPSCDSHALWQTGQARQHHLCPKVTKLQHGLHGAGRLSTYNNSHRTGPATPPRFHKQQCYTQGPTDHCNTSVPMPAASLCWGTQPSCCLHMPQLRSTTSTDLLPSHATYAVFQHACGWMPELRCSQLLLSADHSFTVQSGSWLLEASSGCVGCADTHSTALLCPGPLSSLLPGICCSTCKQHSGKRQHIAVACCYAWTCLSTLCCSSHMPVENLATTTYSTTYSPCD
jgi:hypothetical protein